LQTNVGCYEFFGYPLSNSFTPRRQSRENIIVAQEVLHSMRSRRSGKGLMVIKIDLEKAYDRLKWSFIRETLTNIGLPQQFIDITLV